MFRKTTSWAWALALLLFPALSAAQGKPPAAGKTRVAVLDLRPIGVDASRAELLSEIALTEAASLPYLEVIGRSDIQAMLGFEKQKKILGCEEDSSCIAEIGGALGVKLVLVGSVGQIGALYRVDLKVLETSRSGSVRRVGTNVEGAEEKMVAAVQNAVRALFANEAKAAGVAPAAAAPPAGPAAQSAPPAAPVVTYSGPPFRRWLFGLRIGYARPAGDLDAVSKQADWVKPHGMFQLEAAYKLSPRLSLGASLSYGGASTGSELKGICAAAGLTCDPSVVRLALDANYDFTAPEAQFVPWVNAGIGFESLIVTVNGGAGSISASGFEPFHGSLGVDLRAGKLRIGPYAMWSVARYSTLEVKIGSSTTSGSLDGKAHSYGSFGLRAALEL
jgi:hypothetical protein